MLIGEGDSQAIFRGYSPTSYRLDLLGRFGQTYENIDQTTLHTYSLVSTNRLFSFYIDGNLESTWQNPLSEGDNKKWEELRFGTISATSAQLASIWFDSIEFSTPTLVTPTPTEAPAQAPVTTPAPTPIPGDANADRVVNEADYLAWYNSYTTNPDTASSADFDKNGVVDGFDYVIWLENAE